MTLSSALHFPNRLHDSTRIMDNSDANLDNRLEGQVVVKPIVYGSVSRPILENAGVNPHTHKWTIYLRPYEDDDMSKYVKRVVFYLHESFLENKRCILNPPYEVTETGWGEFEATIKIFFWCPKEKPVIVKHLLKLFSDSLNGNNSLVSESYDEIVFQSPTVRMAQLLNDVVVTAPLQHARNYEKEKRKVQAAIREAHDKIKRDITATKLQLVEANKQIQELKKHGR